MLLSKAVNRRIKEICDLYDLTPTRLAEISHVPLTTILDVLKKDDVCPTLITLAKICRGLDMNLNEFFDDPGFENFTI